MWGTSNAGFTEYGGVVYQNADGTYSYSAPQMGEPCNSDAQSCELSIGPNAPVGTTIVGDYHTHPNLPGGGDFSNLDITTLVDNNFYGFLSTAPSGRTLMFSPINYALWSNGMPGPPPVCALVGPLMGVSGCH